MTKRTLCPRMALLSGAAVAATAVMAQTAVAVPIINAQLSLSGATPFSLLNVGSASTLSESATRRSFRIDGETFIFTRGSDIYTGSVPGIVRSPFSRGSATSYLAAEPGGSLTINFAAAQTSFDLLWGSVDTYNSLRFGASGQTVTGAQIARAVDGVNFGVSNVAVEITNLAPFSSIQVTSSEPAFEFVPGVPVPEPATAALFGVGLLGAVFLCRPRYRR